MSTPTPEQRIIPPDEARELGETLAENVTAIQARFVRHLAHTAAVLGDRLAVVLALVGGIGHEHPPSLNGRLADCLGCLAEKIRAAGTLDNPKPKAVIGPAHTRRCARCDATVTFHEGGPWSELEGWTIRSDGWFCSQHRDAEYRDPADAAGVQS